MLSMTLLEKHVIRSMKTDGYDQNLSDLDLLLVLTVCPALLNCLIEFMIDDHYFCQYIFKRVFLFQCHAGLNKNLVYETVLFCWIKK